MESIDENKVIAKTTQSATSLEDANDTEIRPNIDGGFAWVVLAASFVCNVMLDGVAFTFGLFYIEFLDYFGESKSKTAWTSSVFNGMYLFIGPFVSSLATRFGCRNVTIAGSVMASAALFLSTFVPNISMLIVTYGALGGIGFGLMYLPSIVMVGLYFEKRRAFATGVAVCGSGIGAFAFAPLVEKLLSTYTWQGSMWIISAIALHGIAMGELFRPIVSPTKKLSVSTVLNGNASKYTVDTDQTIERVHQHIGDCASNIADKRVNVVVCPEGGQGEHINKSITLNVDELKSIAGDLSAKKPCANVLIDDEVSRTRRSRCFNLSSLGTCLRSNNDNSVKKQFSLSSIVNLSLLKNPVFCVYGLSCFLCMTGFYVPFVYLPDSAKRSGITRKEAAFLISIIGIANTVCRVLCGWVSDQSWADCLIINNVALIIGGVATMFCPLYTSYAAAAAYAAVFGASIAVFVSLRSIIMVDLMGLGRLSNAFGMVTMCQGLSAFIGAPIAGVLFDFTQSYNYSFYMAGATLTLAGVVCLPLRRLAAWHERRSASHQE